MPLKDLTPKPLQCKKNGCSCGCPALFQDETTGEYVLIGSLEDASKLGIAQRVSEGEVAIRIPQGLLQK